MPATDTARTGYRTQLFHLHLSVYKVAAQVNVNPPRLSRMLNSHVPMPDSVATALDRVIADRERELAPAQEAG